MLTNLELVEDNDERRKIEIPGDPFSSICLNHDGTKIVAALNKSSSDNTICVWDVITSELKHTLLGHKGLDQFSSVQS